MVRIAERKRALIRRGNCRSSPPLRSNETALIEFLFFICALVIGHTYVGHPAVVFLLAKLRPRPWRRAPTDASLAVVVSAFNEQKVIGGKIQNLLGQRFDGSYTIVIANDGSTDDTAEIVREFVGSDGVVLFDFPENRGKSAMMNELVPQLDADIVVFSDATSLWQPDTLQRIADSFADDDVGCIGADIEFVQRDLGAVQSGQGAYWKYERFLRRYGAIAGTNVVVSGTCYAMRRNLFVPLPGPIGEDLANPVHVAFAGKRVLFDPEIAVQEESNVAHQSEVRMRRRVALQNIAAAVAYWRFLSPAYGLAAYQLFAHKYLRVTCWIFMLLALILNVLLAGQAAYRVLLAVQLTFYAMGAIGLVRHRSDPTGRLFYVPYYFLIMNMAYAAALASYLRGERKPTWQPER